MTTVANTLAKHHRGPHPGILAIIFAGLFITGLAFVVSFSPNAPHYPYPYDSITVIETYFKSNSHSVLMCAFFQFGSAIPLGLFTASMVSRLKYQGITASGVHIALFGGLITAFDLIASSLLMWTAAQPSICQNNTSIDLLYYSSFALGGVGYSVPLGLLIAGVAVTGWLSKLLPKWFAFTGLAIAACGALSWLNLIYPQALALIPLTRFPGFIWLAMAGFKLPKYKIEKPAQKN